MTLRTAAGVSIALLAAMFFSGCRPAVVEPMLTGSVVPVHPIETSAKRIALHHTQTIPLETDEWSVAVADILGGEAPEIALVGEREIRLHAMDGSPLRTLSIPPPAMRFGFVEDIDEDGKADFVLGSRNDSTSRVRVIDNRGQIVAEASGGGIADGYTVPHFMHGGAIYFTAGSEIGATPRIVGTFDPAQESIEWLRTDGVQPTGLAYSPDLGAIGVHNRGTTRDVRDASPETITPSDRSAIHTIDLAGQTLAFRPLGASVIEGPGGDDQVSLVESYPVKIDGTDAAYAVVAVNRESSVYRGASEILLVDETGTTLRSRTGPPASRASVAIDDGRASGTRRFTIAVLWSSTGTLELLDDTLALREAITLPGEWHNATLQAVADLDGDARLDYVVADLDRLSVVVGSTRETAQMRFPGEIRTVLVTDASESPLLLVLANDLHFVRLNDTGPERATATTTPPDSLVTEPTPAPSLVARVPGDARTVPSATVRVLAETALPPEYQFAGMHDVTGSDEIELVFVNPARSHWVFLSPTLETTGQFVAPERFNRSTVADDLDGDTKADFVLTTASPDHAVLALNGSGEILFRTPLTPSRNTTMLPLGVDPDVVWVGAVTGHMLRPRGVYALDASTGAIGYFYPMAGFPNDVVSFPGVTLVSNYTPDNTAEVIRSDGLVDRDSAMFIHALQDDGSPHRWASPLELEHQRGNLRFFAMDADSDGIDEAYFTIHRDSTYNPGPTGVYRLDKDGAVERVVAGPDDARVLAYVEQVSGRDHLVTLRYPEGRLEVYDGDFALVGSSVVGDARFVRAWDADADGILETLIIRAGEIEYSRIDSSEAIALGWPDEEILVAWTARDAQSGQNYLVVRSETRVATSELVSRPREE